MYEDSGRCGDLSWGGIVANANECGLVVRRFCLRSSVWVTGRWRMCVINNCGQVTQTVKYYGTEVRMCRRRRLLMLVRRAEGTSVGCGSLRKTLVVSGTEGMRVRMFHCRRPLMLFWRAEGMGMGVDRRRRPLTLVSGTEGMHEYLCCGWGY